MNAEDREILRAIAVLRPGAAYNYDYGHGLSGLSWIDQVKPRPTDDEIRAEMARPRAPLVLPVAAPVEQIAQAIRSTIAVRTLDTHLRTAIAQLAPTEGKPSMRGMKRLATLSHSIVADLDAEADNVADELVANQERAKQSIHRFRAFSGSIKQIADDVDAALGQLTNDPIEGSGA